MLKTSISGSAHAHNLYYRSGHAQDFYQWFCSCAQFILQFCACSRLLLLTILLMRTTYITILHMRKLFFFNNGSAHVHNFYYCFPHAQDFSVPKWQHLYATYARRITAAEMKYMRRTAGYTWDRLQNKRTNCKGVKNNIYFGQIAGIQEKLGTTCK